MSLWCTRTRSPFLDLSTNCILLIYRVKCKTITSFTRAMYKNVPCPLPQGWQQYPMSFTTGMTTIPHVLHHSDVTNIPCSLPEWCYQCPTSFTPEMTTILHVLWVVVMLVATCWCLFVRDYYTTDHPHPTPHWIVDMFMSNPTVHI